MEMNVEKIKVMRISNTTISRTKLTIKQKQLDDVEYFKYLVSMLTNHGRCTCGIKSRTVTTKAAFNNKRALFTGKMGLELRKKLVKC
jgi:hypothetical protein